MAGISSISGAQAAAQSGVQQFKLLQAERNAQQAEQTARALQAEASDAQQAAREAEEEARSVTARADQAQTNAGRARQGVAAIRAVGQSQIQLANPVTPVAQTPKLAGPAAPTRSATPPVVNTQGQLTGTVVNTTA